MEKNFLAFLEFFLKATEKIEEVYMQLPVAGKEDPIYRERVYCYELYHRLRNEMTSRDNFPYMLCGELDKRGHPYMRGNELDKVKPDLLVHVPGDMGKNLVAIEVKAINNANRDGIKKDLTCLTAFRSKGNYKNAIYLIYGNEHINFKNFVDKALILAEDQGNKIDLDLINLYWHRPGSEAKKKEWKT